PAFSTQMAETVTCPTVVVPRDWEPSDGPVVVGVEDDGSDDAAVEFAAREAETLGKEVVLVHAWRSTAPGASSFDADLGRTGYEAAAATRLMDVSRGVRAAYPGLPITPLLDHDKPASAVIRAAAGASLIVVGTHRMDALDRLRFSSVSRTVLERSRCPVAIVPPA
ncbi:MAG: hypothetical protein QOJ68_2766, partial [Blastococcus sp.]|nr:hypothetical protein [Blastococcus sp.]